MKQQNLGLNLNKRCTRKALFLDEMDLVMLCLSNIECKVTDIVERHNIVVLEGVAAYLDTDRKEQRRVHAVGDGTFIVDGRRLDRKKMMAAKLPAGV